MLMKKKLEILRGINEITEVYYFSMYLVISNEDMKMKMIKITASSIL